jgi:O6-methylguanine-DNA--protein-cysteine methyltransferase
MKSIFVSTCIVLLSLFYSGKAICQTQEANTELQEKLTPKEFAIPTSPLFDLMGVAPSQIARTASIKDFKVDWSFKNWRINPNLAIQAQPVWELFYNKKDLAKYQSASRFQRMLASLDVSIGTVQADQTDRRIGGAFKLNLYNQKDPLLIKDAYKDIQQTFEEELAQLKQKEKDLLKQLDSLSKPSELLKTRDELRQNDLQLASYFSRKKAAIQEKAAQFVANNWNAAFVDIAYGKIFTYGTDSAGSLKKLKLNRSTGNGFWLNFGMGVGKRGLISGLIRSTFYEEEVTFNLLDAVTNEETSETTIASNNLFSFGMNFRYGGPVYNFFAEVIYEGKKIRTPVDAVNESFSAPNGKTIVTSSVKWDVVNPYTVNFGGDWRISRNVVLNYGMRLLLDKNYKTVSFTPIANISCMMR